MWLITMSSPSEHRLVVYDGAGCENLLEANDFTGKTVIPFMTNGGWPGHVIKDMKQAAKGAEFGPSLEVQFDSNGGSDLVSDTGDIDRWAADIKRKYSEKA